jgi:hypothetical protein
MKETPGGGTPVKLGDVLNYDPEQELSAEELSLIQHTFKGNNQLIAVLRKVFLPTLSDPSLPIEKFGSDPFLRQDWAAMPHEHVKAIVLARQDAVKFIIGGLIQLKMIANQEVETEMERALRLSKDSTK